jgi:hypothetical protein
MIIFFNSRESARKATFGKLFDAGVEAPKGQRYGRKVTGLSGNAHQRKVALKKAMRACHA